jgi:phosphoribosylglycinamide formyltransferase-1
VPENWHGRSAKLFHGAAAARAWSIAEVRLGILISGRGSNFEAIANQIARRKLDAEIAVVISNRADAPGLETARQRGIPMRVLASAGLERETYDKLLIEELKTHEADLICLAGFMRLLSAGFIRAFPDRVLNIHPSLLPAFPGLDAQRQALEYGARITGCTVHFVDEYLDSGPIVMQSAVPVLDNDTVDSLAARILTQEHLIYSKAIQYVAEGRVTIEGRRVRIREDE